MQKKALKWDWLMKFIRTDRQKVLFFLYSNNEQSIFYSFIFEYYTIYDYNVFHINYSNIYIIR